MRERTSKPIERSVPRGRRNSQGIQRRGDVSESLASKHAVMSLQVSIGWAHLGTRELGCASFRAKADEVWAKLLAVSYVNI